MSLVPLSKVNVSYKYSDLNEVSCTKFHQNLSNDKSSFTSLSK
jgi:hypothetical protein